MDKKTILNWVVLWRVVLTIVSLVAIWWLPYKPSFPYSDVILSPLGPRWLTAWANFDGVHYLTIVEKGYFGIGAIQAFFPLYPLLVRLISAIGLNPLLVGVLISTVSFWAALVMLSKLLKLDYEKKLVTRSLILIIMFPTAFFFTAFYTESLFLLWIVLSFYWARKKNFLVAGLFGVLAAATRIVGIFLLPSLLVELWVQNRKTMFKTKNIKGVIGSLLPVAGTLSYMGYLKKVFGDALLFLHVQPQFGVQREVDRVILLYQVFWRYAKMVATVAWDSLLYYNVWFELIIAVLFLTLLIMSFKRVRASYATFGILALLAPTLTGTFTSLPRYVLVLFPAFVLLAGFLTTKQYRRLLFFSGILLVINVMLFIQGYWIA